ncbi:hypothetical protein BCV69DRAFT_299314 [Microstroma glucosiphilum]|uniref:Inositolphosphotransferase Aur1/Ipt1 domain-containing protein n=1 Tax=Pseudomicrostroma glucosiphilum TaxID=1684307 RepID=A0A316U6J8_9BASI|nr:hypothetical protein BCV69DRAFT_299314 [Pseudomicrostroma glucosiphilum]PWN20842.1 hypothetical protein BCV69DRAFT_299314 [Pseudomicrostroma glucosiphilum]
MLTILKDLWAVLAVLAFLLLVTSQGRRLVVHCTRVLLNGKNPLRWLVGLLAGILPPVTWTLAFKLARNIPSDWRPDIHTHLLPVFEAILLSPTGIILLTILVTPFAYLIRRGSRTQTSRVLYPSLILLFPAWLKVMNLIALGTTWTPFQDVLAWIFYGVLHFASPFLAGWWIWGFGPPGAAIVYGVTLGVQNICGLFTHLVFPNAAPWYYDVYPNTTIPTYDFPGNPAGLVRVDQALGTHLYRAAFKKSPVVFGALPSLHAASAVCFSLFVARYGGRWGHIIMLLYSTFMFWSTQYLHHHFAVDLLLGTSYSVLAFSAATIVLRKLEAKHEREGTTRGVDRLFCWPAPHAHNSALPQHTGQSRASVDADAPAEEERKRRYRGKGMSFWLSSGDDAKDEEKAMMLEDLSERGASSPEEDHRSIASGSRSTSFSSASSSSDVENEKQKRAD